MTQRPGYPPITPYLVYRNADAAVRWYTRHLSARERYRLNMPDGAVAHAEIDIKGTILMIADEIEAWGISSPQKLGGSPVSLNVYVDDCDQTFADMLADGAEQIDARKVNSTEIDLASSKTRSGISGISVRIQSRSTPTKLLSASRKCSIEALSRSKHSLLTQHCWQCV